MRVQDFLADLVSRTACDYAFWLGKTDPAGFDWVPGDPQISKARTLNDQAAECVSINHRFAAMLTRRAPEETPEAFSTVEQAQKALIASGKAFGEAIAGTSDETLEREFDFPFGKLTGLQMIKIAARNLNYHAGVVNCYQLMLGDEEFHMPPRD